VTSQTIYAVLSRMEITRLSPSCGDDAKAQGAHVPPSRIGRSRTHNGRSSHLIMARSAGYAPYRPLPDVSF
jgi:hypothetical protein